MDPKELKVLVLHNSYLKFGAEDLVFQSETAGLKRAGMNVLTYNFSNKDFTELPTLKKLSALKSNTSTQTIVSGIIAAEKPDLIHIHNPYFQIPIGLYQMIHKLGIPIVQTLHNLRMVCPKVSLWRNGGDCAKCPKSGSYLHSVIHKCYRDSYKDSAGMALFLRNFKKGGFEELISTFITLSDRHKELLIKNGFNGKNLVVKPHFIPNEFRVPEKPKKPDQLLFAGRYSEEKGILQLIRAWKAEKRNSKLILVGQGPLEEELRKEVGTNNPNDTAMLEHMTREEILMLMQESSALVVPSLLEEPFGLVNIESLSVGTPILASKKGAMRQLIQEGKSGMFFNPEDQRSILKTLRFHEEQPEAFREMGNYAKANIDPIYRESPNIQALIKIYLDTLAADGSANLATTQAVRM